MRALVLFLLPMAAAQAAKTLDIYFIDVEGGQTTLLVAPSGQSLLIDAGYAGFGGRDADRIAKAAKAAGVKRIDYLLITHFHPDHVGGAPQLLERLPVTEFLDHGPSIEEQGKYPEAYAKAIEKGQHRVIAPGDAIPIKGVDVTVVASAGRVMERSGDSNPFCGGLTPRPENEGDEAGENSQSAGVLVQFGKFRFGDFGDMTWNKQLTLLCPQNRVGRLDLWLTTHHGGESPQAIWGLAPRVAIMNNGPRKGGDPAGWKVIAHSPGIEDLWQLHFAIAAGKDANAPDSLIANVEENCAGQYLKASALPDGSFTVFNQRNKYTKAYGAR